jgi:hypothetical protein
MSAKTAFQKINQQPIPQRFLQGKKTIGMLNGKSDHFLNFRMGSKKYPGCTTVINTQAIPTILYSSQR